MITDDVGLLHRELCSVAESGVVAHFKERRRHHHYIGGVGVGAEVIVED